MTRYYKNTRRTITDKILVKTVCNMCGEEIDPSEDSERGSTYFDKQCSVMEIHESSCPDGGDYSEAHICIPCSDKLVASFKVKMEKVYW